MSFITAMDHLSERMHWELFRFFACDCYSNQGYDWNYADTVFTAVMEESIKHEHDPPTSILGDPSQCVKWLELQKHYIVSRKHADDLIQLHEEEEYDEELREIWEKYMQAKKEHTLKKWEKRNIDCAESNHKHGSCIDCSFESNASKHEKCVNRELQKKWEKEQRDNVEDEGEESEYISEDELVYDTEPDPYVDWFD